MNSYKPLIRLLLKTQETAKKMGIKDVFRIGMAREIILADYLQHTLIFGKRDSDAVLGTDKFEYLTCLEEGSFQFHRMHKESLVRITRNKFIYCAVFYKQDPLKIKTLYKVEPQKMAHLAEQKIESSRNEYAHLSFSVQEIENLGQEIKLS